MNLVPEWAPNVHPLVVHFPIALVIAAALADALALAVRRRAFRVAAAALYVAAAAGALAAYLTGDAAEETVEVAGAAVGALNAHADWAGYTVWVLGLYGLLRLGAAAWDRRNRLALHLPLAVIGLGAVFLVWQTAERGARLVFEYGVGVRAAEPLADPFAGAGGGGHAGREHHADVTAGEAEAPALQTTAEGAWRWATGTAALPQGLRFLEGDREALALEADAGAVVLRPRGPVLLTAGEPLAGVEVRATLDLSGFTGTVALVHHVQDARNYDFLAVERTAEGGAVRQGRVREGQRTLFDERPLGADALDGPVALRAVGYGTHFRGYADGDLVAHGHGDAAPAGTAGLRLDGSGTVRLALLEAVPVAE